MHIDIFVMILIKDFKSQLNDLEESCNLNDAPLPKPQDVLKCYAN